ncbi:hypothetical protein PRZ48_000465 [Zasmidium cellare]|uniref:Uncharacterized protein n=1 Tax=Zasmidium cellare TaxID=395010 RepID=A0ABR0EYV7_ZASCE|nr:hypothetical protein PRZ48_000465 [Zasmidium cellare]
MSVNLSGEVQLNADGTSAASHSHRIDVVGSVGFDGEWVLRKFFCDGTGDTIHLERRLGIIDPAVEDLEEKGTATPEIVAKGLGWAKKRSDLIPKTLEQQLEDVMQAAKEGKPLVPRNRSRQVSYNNVAGQAGTASTDGPAVPAATTRKRNRKQSMMEPDPKVPTIIEDDDEDGSDDPPDEDQPPAPKRGRAGARTKATASTAPGKAATTAKTKKKMPRAPTPKPSKKGARFPNLSPRKEDADQTWKGNAEQDESEVEDDDEGYGEGDGVESEVEQEPPTAAAAGKKKKERKISAALLRKRGHLTSAQKKE